MTPLLYAIGATLVLAITVVVFRLIVPRSYRQRGRLTWSASAAQYVAILAWVAFVYLNLQRGWPAVRVGLVQETIGWVLFLGGWVVVLTSLLRLGVRRSHGLQVNALRRTGLYGLTRNPQTVAFLIAMFGYLVLWPSWRNVGALVLVGILSHLMIRAEEDHLRDVFGPRYDRYIRCAPRYLGFPSRRNTNLEDQEP